MAKSTPNVHTVESFEFVIEDIFSCIAGYLVFHRDVISLMRQFSVLVRKLILSTFVFVEDVNSWGRATHEF